ncbi:HET-domain-containing protein, partial [Glonium stellatum]
LTQWLTQCLNTHRGCIVEGASDNWLPTRLIDVGEVDCEREPRLVISSTETIEPREARYLTLSHRWGSLSMPKLLSNNLENMKQRIVLSNLPQTFQEAIYITKKLRIRYIWIDSLCIVQNNEEDWLQEAALMGKVYERGLCNIAATASAEEIGAMFVERDPALNSSILLTIASQKHMQTCYCVTSRLWEKMVCQAQLNQRGWVLQERVLSSRTIHFASQLFWECCEFQACETYPGGIPTSELRPDPPSGLKALVRPRLSLGTSQESVHLHQAWKYLVEAYSLCKLTVTSDKLLAISGIARQIARPLGDEYLAGVWKGDLARELLWAVPYHPDSGNPASILEGPQRFRPKEYRAPSWSWASLDFIHGYIKVSGFLMKTPELSEI